MIVDNVGIKLVSLLFIQNEMIATDSGNISVMILIGLAFLILAFLIFIVLKNRKSHSDIIKKQNKEIEIKNKELAFANDSLRSTNSEKNNMVSIVAHDLKTPLGNIEGLANLINIEQDRLSEDQKKYIKLIMETTKGAMNTIESLLDVHKIEADIGQIRMMRQNYIVLLADVIRTHTPQAELKGIKIELEEHVRIQEINTDKEYFKQIFSNILENAIRYSLNDEKVTILITENENTFRFDISDVGPGMDESTKKRLYTTYIRTDDSGKSKVTGLGLSIARNLIEKLTGKITFTTSDKDGTTFSVEFFKK